MRDLTKTLMIGSTILVGSVLPTAVSADDANPWQVRVRLISVAPDESSTISVIGGEAVVSTEYVPELDITYFFNNNISAELILATTRHNVSADGTAVGDAPVGKVSLLPPTLLAQYHFAPDSTFRPYVGAGINYTFFYNEDADGTVVTSTNYKDGFGFALQAGVDFAFEKDSPWFFNVDVKKLWLSTDVDLSAGATNFSADVDLNPWIVGAGIGYKF